jgi:hypothetical protein
LVLNPFSPSQYGDSPARRSNAHASVKGEDIAHLKVIIYYFCATASNGAFYHVLL